MSPTPSDIDAICTLVDDLCGLYWDDSKAYLIESRLGSFVDRCGCSSYVELARKVRAEMAPGLKAEVIDAVTTHETLWFRDASPFEALKYKIVPELIDAKEKSAYPRRLRIWSAACSTGQEPFSIAMTLAEMLPDIARWDVQILGTDVSLGSIQQANRACYSDLEIGRGLSPAHQQKFFTRVKEGWQVRDEIRSLCSFAARNLHEPYYGLGPFDIIFCRNVAIYFASEDRRSIFTRMVDVLNLNGWILAGSAESLSDLGADWTPQFHCRANCYRPKMATATVAGCR